MEPALREGYETARRMLRRHDPTYYLATRRLPAPIQPATYALYGYVRAADQLVDGPRRPPSPTERRAALDAWEAQLHAPRHPVALALTDAAHRHGLPLEELSTYMRSMRVDCEPPIRIDTYEQLATYMDGRAHLNSNSAPYLLQDCIPCRRTHRALGLKRFICAAAHRSPIRI